MTVKPKSKVQKLTEIDESNYIAQVRSSPESGKANEELIRLLADKFDVPKSRVDIIRGEKSHIKLVEIQNEI